MNPSEIRFSINAAAKRSGLTPHVIRIWERRYRAVQPMRTQTDRRLYTPPEVDRLCALRAAVAAGHRIGTIAKLSLGQLRSLVAEATPGGAFTEAANGSSPGTDDLVRQLIEAVRRFNGAVFGRSLEEGLVAFGHQGLLQRVIGPLAEAVGELWQAGEITAANEHFASGLLEAFLWKATRPFARAQIAPSIVVATPAGQLHGLGAMTAAAAATNAGWRVVYLGTSLPAAEIAGAVRLRQARAVALSLVYPADDPELADELRALREYLGQEIPVIAGGRAVAAYRATLEEIGAKEMRDLTEFGQWLERVREPGLTVPGATGR